MNQKRVFFMLVVLLAIVIVTLPTKSKADELPSQSTYFEDDLSNTYYVEASDLIKEALSTGDKEQARILYNTALSKYNEVLKIHPNNPMILFNRGTVYTQLGEYEKGIEDYNTFLMTSPNDSLALENRGRIYELMGDIENSYKDYKAVQLYLNEARRRTTKPDILSRFDKDLLRINQKLKELEDALDKEGKSLPEVLAPPLNNPMELNNSQKQSAIMHAA